MCGLLDGGCTGFSVIRGLFGRGGAWLVCALQVPWFMSFEAMPGLCCFLRVTPVNAADSFDTEPGLVVLGH